MLPPKIQLPPDQQRLLKLFRGLDARDREQLLTFAAFLAERAQTDDALKEAGSSEESLKPLDIPRPATESVVAAIRRLSETFPMLDREPLLHETSALMTAHVMQGRAADDVIDELELLFKQHYERLMPGSG